MARYPNGLMDELSMVTASDTICMPSLPAEETDWPTLDELFAAQVKRVPQQLAIVCEDQQITYAELDRRSSSLAVRLKEAGAGPDAVIALVAERSIHFVVGMLAVLKAGAAWLPIEPDTPCERMEYMMKQANAVAVLTQQALPQPIECGDLPSIFLDDPSVGAEQLYSRKTVPASRLAYVIFTSGSTGRPKGVAIEHRQVASYVHALLERVHPQEQCRLCPCFHGGCRSWPHIYICILELWGMFAHDSCPARSRFGRACPVLSESFRRVRKDRACTPGSSLPVTA